MVDSIDVRVALHRGMDDSILVSKDGFESLAQWLPRSQITITQTHDKLIGTERSGRERQLNIAKITMPKWLAKRAGLI